MKKHNGKFQTGGVVLISTAHLVHDTFSSFLAPLLPLLIEKLGISYAMAGMLTVVQRAPTLLNPLMGLLADRIRMRYLLIAAPAITAISMSLIGMAPDYGTLILLLLAMGVGTMCFHVPGPVLIRAVAGERVGLGMSYFMLGGELARTIGPLVILAAVTWWGLEGTWRLIPFGLGASILLLMRFRKLTIHMEHANGRPSTGVAQALRQLAPFLVILAGFTISRAFMKSALTVFLPAYLAGKGHSLWFAGISLSALELTGAIGTFFGGGLSDKIGRRTTLLAVSVISPILGWTFLLSDGAVAIGVLLVLGFFLFAGGPVVLALVQDVHCERPAFLNGIYMTLNFLGTGLTALAVGWGSDRIGMDMTFRWAVTASLLAVPFVWGLADRHLLHEPDRGE